MSLGRIAVSARADVGAAFCVGVSSAITITRSRGGIRVFVESATVPVLQSTMTQTTKWVGAPALARAKLFLAKLLQVEASFLSLFSPLQPPPRPPRRACVPLVSKLSIPGVACHARGWLRRRAISLWWVLRVREELAERMLCDRSAPLLMCDEDLHDGG